MTSERPQLVQALDAAAKESRLRGRRWMLTINNPSFREAEVLYRLGHTDDIDCLVYGAEHGEEGEGTPHFQIYIHFKQPWRWNRVKNLFPRADVELARKPKLACCRYCAKEGFYYKFGPKAPEDYLLKPGNNEPGSRRAREHAEDMERSRVVHNMRTGQIMFKELSDEQLLDKKLISACEKAMNMTMGPPRPFRYICTFVSPTGWGKTYNVWESFMNVATVEFGGTQEWFCDPENYCMLFDEFCGQIRCQKMLKYLDNRPISLPIKGGHRPCYWQIIFICSNTAPDEWYTKEDPKTGLKVSSIPDEVRKALYRRIGYPMPTESGETHVYNEVFTDMLTAREEMRKTCVKLQERMLENIQKQQVFMEEYMNRMTQLSDRVHEALARHALQAEVAQDFNEPEYQPDHDTQPDVLPGIETAPAAMAAAAKTHQLVRQDAMPDLMQPEHESLPDTTQVEDSDSDSDFE